MNRRKKIEPSTSPVDSSDADKSAINSISNHTTESVDCQASDEDTQLYKANWTTYNMPQGLSEETKGRHWLFIVYEDSAPANWRELLAATGLPFAVSPYHNGDNNPDNTPKKPHWHVIVSYSNTTTYRNICGLRDITHGPYPMICRSVAGAYAYFTHKNNPEKHQYDPALIERYNGFEKTLEAHEVSAIMNELTHYVFTSDVSEYAELLVATMSMDGDYQAVAQSHTLYFDRLITSYRHNPVRALSRYVNLVDDEQLQQELIERMEMYSEQLQQKKGD